MQYNYKHNRLNKGCNPSVSQLPAKRVNAFRKEMEKTAKTEGKKRIENCIKYAAFVIQLNHTKIGGIRMRFIDLAKKRESVRQFKDDTVPREALEYCLEAARIAPSARNTQPWKFVVVDDPHCQRRGGRMCKLARGRHEHVRSLCSSAYCCGRTVELFIAVGRQFGAA